MSSKCTHTFNVVQPSHVSRLVHFQIVCIFIWRFELPGGKIKLKGEDEETDLPPIKGRLSTWGNLTAALAETLEELQKSGGVHNPRPLFNQLVKLQKQFDGGDQHDSHELLRHLLESVKWVVDWKCFSISQINWRIYLHFVCFVIVYLLQNRRFEALSKGYSGLPQI